MGAYGGYAQAYNANPYGYGQAQAYGGAYGGATYGAQYGVQQAAYGGGYAQATAMPTNMVMPTANVQYAT